MGLSELWSMFRSIHVLSKEHDKWAIVYKQYLVCILLLFLIGGLRYVTECVVSVFILYVIYTVASHPSIVQTLMATSFYKWLATYAQSFSWVFKSL